MVKANFIRKTDKGGLNTSERDVPSCGNGRKVRIGDPSVPVSLEHRSGDGTVLVLVKCPFIDDPWIPGDIKERGGDPWLTGTWVKFYLNFYGAIRTSNTSQPPKLTPRTF